MASLLQGVVVFMTAVMGPPDGNNPPGPNE